MQKVVNVYKPAGFTPLEVIEALKEKNLEYRDVSVTYAGRLDPMAEGVLVLLVGEAVYKKDEYLALDKEYEAEILFGFKTDTFDVLGLPSLREGNFKISQEKLNEFKGDFEFSLPVYSSFKVKGKPLFWWEKEGRVDEIEIPKRKTKIYNIELLDFYEINSGRLLGLATERISLVKGDFRQEEIKKKWQGLLKKDRVFKVAKVRVFCSSGTYVRALADKLGGVLLRLKRTRVGDFNLKDSVNICN